jgi:hypothetical protein
LIQAVNCVAFGFVGYFRLLAGSVVCFHTSRSETGCRAGTRWPISLLYPYHLFAYAQRINL